MTDQEYQELYDSVKIHFPAYEHWDENGDPVSDEPQ